VKLAPIESAPKKNRVPGAWKGPFTVPDSFFDPLPEEELRAREGRGFDGILIEAYRAAQAKLEGLLLITGDKVFRQFDIQTAWWTCRTPSEITPPLPASPWVSAPAAP
jgi:hypothetical protein